MCLRRVQRRKSPKLNLLKEGGDGVSITASSPSIDFLFDFLDTDEF